MLGPRMMRGGPSPAPGPAPAPRPAPLPLPCPPRPAPGAGLSASGATPMTSGCSGAGRGGATTSGFGGAGDGRGGRTTEGAAGAPPPCAVAGSTGGVGGGGGGGGGSGRSNEIRSTRIGGGASGRRTSSRPIPKSTKAPRCRRVENPAAPQRQCLVRFGRNRLSRSGFRTPTLQKPGRIRACVGSRVQRRVDGGGHRGDIAHAVHLGQLALAFIVGK